MRDLSDGPDDTRGVDAATFNFTPVLVTARALLFLGVTIPLAGPTDRLIERARRRRLAATT